MQNNTPEGFIDPGLIDETIYDFTEDEYDERPEGYQKYYKKNFPDHSYPDTEDNNFEQ